MACRRGVSPRCTPRGAGGRARPKPIRKAIAKVINSISPPTASAQSLARSGVVAFMVTFRAEHVLVPPFDGGLGAPRGATGRLTREDGSPVRIGASQARTHRLSPWRTARNAGCMKAYTRGHASLAPSLARSLKRNRAQRSSRLSLGVWLSLSLARSLPHRSLLIHAHACTACMHMHVCAN